MAGRTIGSIILSFPGAFDADPVVLDFLDIMADTCAQAFERIEASVVARRQTARLAFLAEASIELASSLDLEVTINRVARLAVPTFADWCAIDVVRDGRVHRLAVAHVDPEKVELARRAAGALAHRPVQPHRRLGGGAHREARADPRDHRRDARGRLPRPRAAAHRPRAAACAVPSSSRCGSAAG